MCFVKIVNQGEAVLRKVALMGDYVLLTAIDRKMDPLVVRKEDVESMVKVVRVIKDT